MKNQNRNHHGDILEATAGASDILDEKVSEAVERSYAARLTEGTDLSEEEKKRIQEKQAGSSPSPRPDREP